MYEQNFAEYKVTNLTSKFTEDEKATKMGCTGTLALEMNVKTVTKSCEGVVVKSRTKGDGTGTLTLTMHCKHSELVKMRGMELDTLKEGVYAYGKNSTHKEFCLTAEVFDEDDVKKLIAFPRVIATNGIATTIENGAEEVAQVEIQLTVQPDDFGNGYYEAIESLVTDESLKTSWLENFTPALVQTATV